MVDHKTLYIGLGVLLVVAAVAAYVLIHKSFVVTTFVVGTSPASCEMLVTVPSGTDPTKWVGKTAKLGYKPTSGSPLTLSSTVSGVMVGSTWSGTTSASALAALGGAVPTAGPPAGSALVQLATPSAVTGWTAGTYTNAKVTFV